MANNQAVFKGKDAVIKAYEFNKVAPWAVFVDRIPMFSFDEDDLSAGADLLDQVLEDMKKWIGAGTYQLRIYREVPAKGITNATPFNYGLKFQLLDDDEYEARPGGKIAALQRRIEELECEDEEEEDTSFMGRVGSFLKKRPDVENFLMQKIMGWVNQAMTPKQPPPANMAGFTTMDTTQQPGQEQPPTAADLYNRLSPDERTKFDQAAYILLSGDPLIGTHLMKLANLLHTNPATYEMLTKM